MNVILFKPDKAKPVTEVRVQHYLGWLQRSGSFTTRSGKGRADAPAFLPREALSTIMQGPLIHPGWVRTAGFRRRQKLPSKMTPHATIYLYPV